MGSVPIRLPGCTARPSIRRAHIIQTHIMPTSQPSNPITFDRVMRIVATALFVVGAIWTVSYLRNVLVPFFVACLISYLLYPLVELNSRCLRLKSQAAASLITIFEVTCLLFFAGYFIVPSIVDEIRQLQDIISRGTSSSASVPFIPEEIAEPIKEWISSIDIRKLMGSSHLEALLSSGTSFISWSIGLLLHTLEWLMTFIYVIFILVDYKSLMQGFRMLVPKKYRRATFRVVDDIKDSMNRYFRSQLLIALCAAVFYCIGFSIVGIPMAIVLGVTVGVLYIIPYFQYVTLIPVTLVCLIDSLAGPTHFWTQLGECLLVYVVSQCICDYILTPKIMGKAMGLNPAIILLSLSVWGSLLGLIGMIIALPLTTLLLAYYQRYANGGDDNAEGAIEPDSR